MTTWLIKDTHGKPSGMWAIVRDITERKRHEILLMARLELREFAESHIFDDLLQKIIDDAERLTSSSIGFFHLVDRDQKSLHLQMWSTNTLNNMCTAEAKGSHYPINQPGV